MPLKARIVLFTLLGLVPVAGAGCNLVPYENLRYSQSQALRLHQENQSLAMENQQAQQAVEGLAAENQHLQQRTAGLKKSLETANKRVANLKSGLTEAQQRYVGLLQKARNQKSPLSDEATRRFKQLDEKYPNFEFDPHTGVSKFHSDILFGSGSAHVKQSARPMLREFASIMNGDEAQRLNILVVGHTDDRPIVRPSTESKHPTNWHLSTNRANSVVLTLKDLGLSPERMGVAGYSMYQPVAPNSDDEARSLNRRVEIYVLAPDAIVAGWDPETSRN